MTDTSRERNLEIGLFALAFGLALAIRLLRLGEQPLTDSEATWAMQAFDLTKGLRPEIGVQPAYVLLTAFLFFVLQASNFVARFVPALFGAVLTFTPFYFRDRLGGKPAIVLAFFLAFDPGLLALSRLAGSPVIALAAGLFAWGLWRAGNVRAAGIWAGVALLGGPLFWPGLLGLAVAAGLLRGFFVKEEGFVGAEPFDRKQAITFAVFAAGTYIIVGSLFLLVTGGLSAGLAAIPAYFGGWLDFTDVPAWRLLVGLASYELLAVLLAIAGLVRGLLRRDALVISLGIWLAVALVLALAYPSRQVADLAWVMIPLLVLAALEVSNFIIPIQDGTWETLGMTVFTIAILTFVCMNFTTIALVSTGSNAIVRTIGSIQLTSSQLSWGMLIISLALLGASIAMVAYGWSVAVAIQGSVWGLLVVFSIYSLSTALAAGGLRTYRTVEMWPVGPYTKQAETLVNQMNDLSRGKTGANASLDVTLAGVDSPSLRWVLRDWPVTVTPGLVVSETPSMIIAFDQPSQSDIESTYRGQEFIWRTYPAWDQALPTDWLRWSLLHEFPEGNEKIILWARSDVFIDSQNNK
jgi:hypothetical protein